MLIRVLFISCLLFFSTSLFAQDFSDQQIVVMQDCSNVFEFINDRDNDVGSFYQLDEDNKDAFIDSLVICREFISDINSVYAAVSFRDLRNFSLGCESTINMVYDALAYPETTTTTEVVCIEDICKEQTVTVETGNILFRDSFFFSDKTLYVTFACFGATVPYLSDGGDTPPIPTCEEDLSFLNEEYSSLQADYSTMETDFSAIQEELTATKAALDAEKARTQAAAATIVRYRDYITRLRESYIARNSRYQSSIAQMRARYTQQITVWRNRYYEVLAQLNQSD